MGKVFVTDRELRFGDCDISGTAYFPSYLNLLNGVNEEYWAHIGYPWHEIIWKERWGTPTVHLTCDFSIPSLFGQTLTFELRVVRVGRSSVTLKHEISCKGEKRWNSTQVLAASDLDKHTSVAWPDAVKATLDDWLVTDEGA
ncbi:acyl-CoA thioesterase [Sulfitobacter mediterraneus]|mgnify:FL=1|jgi:4-hydroxybenzoyl-CoA thioesterase|uniref:4-hydroxybenzoyl-CoA thioesterase n=1 Tax=Sulfitobacter mediterraneus TaxID=83219 RepID=A0A061SW98_9RHOB|nr:thioesterase family protein [Sulfitobacter mediterraneus]KAJ04064.1 4-hydroxybenzoyl-CoA thioesterase [Sulfitobacter mediterraneus]KIN75894.1 Thioesterase family protein [Sulfitobacter mediterraneus KCTC 32188]MBM1557690.1 acyl-CoA thioesterase [Sulfitobacter mediterraneus]MBM1569419.1 acyl-CoA thioesterase [Sulfitobacter mediterraneus]MBM1572863.1 acyl-CoA thioesterase [Sulfitobacter mediterraneus]